MPDLTILHTNDFHGKLSAEAADRIACQKSSTDACLLLDAGDAASSGNVYYRPAGEPMLARMSDLGYDAMVMGNREFHFLRAGLRSKVKLARFPVLSANLRAHDPDAVRPVVPSIGIAVGGLKVVILGLSVPMIARGTLVGKFSPFWFEDPIRAAAEIVPGLREETDLLIALTHIGLRRDTELAGAAPGIDLIVSGHSHAALEEPQVIGTTAIVQAGCWGRWLGKVEVSLASSSRGRPDIRGGLIALRSET